MKLSRQKILFWLPRGLGLLFAGFLGLFALDVFGAGYGFWETAVALLMHLIPTIVLLIVLGLSWRWPWIGAIGFVGFAIWYVIAFWARFPVSVYLLLAGLPFLLGLLFLVDWWQRRGDRRQSTAARPT